MLGHKHYGEAILLSPEREDGADGSETQHGTAER